MMVVLVVLVHLGHLVQIALKAEGLEGRQDVLWIDRFPALLFADIVGLGRNNMDKLCLSAFAALRQRKNLPPPPIRSTLPTQQFISNSLVSLAHWMFSGSISFIILLTVASCRQNG